MGWLGSGRGGVELAIPRGIKKELKGLGGKHGSWNAWSGIRESNKVKNRVPKSGFLE